MPQKNQTAWLVGALLCAVAGAARADDIVVNDWRLHDTGLIVTGPSKKSFFVRSDALAKRRYRIEKNGEYLRFIVEKDPIAFGLGGGPSVDYSGYGLAENAALGSYLTKLRGKFAEAVEDVSPPSGPIKLESLDTSYHDGYIWVNKKWRIVYGWSGLSHDETDAQKAFMNDYYVVAGNTFEHQPREGQRRVLPHAESEALINRLLAALPGAFTYHPVAFDNEGSRNDRRGSYSSAPSAPPVRTEKKIVVQAPVFEGSK